MGINIYFSLIILELIINSLPPNLLVVFSIGGMNILIDFFDIEFVLIQLGLEHIKLCCDGFHLAGFEFDLVLKLTDNFGLLNAGLPLEQLPQLLNVFFLLLLNHLLLHHLFCLLNQTSLQCQNLHVHLVTIRVCPFQFPVSVFIQWVLQFFA